MFKMISTVLVLLSTVGFSVNSYGQFQVNYEERNDDKIVLYIDTDLPDDAMTFVWIRRAYEATDVSGHQDTFVVDYFYVRDEPLSKWKTPQLISLDDKAWKAELIDFQDKMGRIPGAGFTIDDIDNNIEVRVSVVENTKSPRKTLVEEEFNIYRPLKDDPESGESRIVAYNNLKTGQSYILLGDKIPLMLTGMSSDDINDLRAAKSLSSGMKIEVKDIGYTSGSHKWYFVSLIDIPELQGWINSTALMKEGVELYD